MFGEGAGNSRGMIPRCMEEVFAQLDRKAKVRSVTLAREVPVDPLPKYGVPCGGLTSVDTFGR